MIFRLGRELSQSGHRAFEIKLRSLRFLPPRSLDHSGNQIRSRVAIKNASLPAVAKLADPA